MAGLQQSVGRMVVDIVLVNNPCTFGQVAVVA